jgi:hypothetical protein
MPRTILTDGRRVRAEECVSLEDALMGTDQIPEIAEDKRGDWHMYCQCCEGTTAHLWSPSGHTVDPDAGEYECDPCRGVGRFKVQMP